jgi:2-(1,2-epoxy-1,2-dihydrophenyl)acetyl-CoA isomerase
MTTNASSSPITVDLQDHIAIVEIHRPPHNYFDVSVLTELADTIDRLGPDAGCRAIVLCSEGKNFCAGADLSSDSVLDKTNQLYAIAARLLAAPIPTIAAVQGSAVGGGFGLSLITDFRVGSPRTRFACNFAKLGFHHGFGISETLPPIVGQQRALEILYTGSDIRGEEARAIGLIDRLADDDELRHSARRLAEEIAMSGPLAVSAIRQTMRGPLVDRVRAATHREAQQQERLRNTSDFREGVKAMAERRPPRFTGS